MEKSIAIIFFTNSNHESNVKTLQSIAKQDYKKIYLIVCNDCTYGFDNERLLNNFQQLSKSNIEQIYFKENEYPIGEYQSIVNFCERLDVDYLITIHSGEYFTSPKIVGEIAKFLDDHKEVDAVVGGVEVWSDNFDSIIGIDNFLSNSIQSIVIDNNLLSNENITILDCMVVYRFVALKKYKDTSVFDFQTNSEAFVFNFVKQQRKIAFMKENICRYSNKSIWDKSEEIPNCFGNPTLNSIKTLIENRNEKEDNYLFKSPICKKQELENNDLIRKTYKYCTLNNIKYCTMLELLILLISIALFLLDRKIFLIIGSVFLGLATIIFASSICMLCINIYFKRNPQRLINRK